MWRSLLHLLLEWVFLTIKNILRWQKCRYIFLSTVITKELKICTWIPTHLSASSVMRIWTCSWAMEHVRLAAFKTVLIVQIWQHVLNVMQPTVTILMKEYVHIVMKATNRISIMGSVYHATNQIISFKTQPVYNVT